MELFHNARTVRLRSHHDKYLLADDDGESVCQDRHHGETKRARWTVEYVKSVEGVHLVRLKSCYRKYLTATDDPFLMGVTGNKVVQSLPERLDSSVEWEPFRNGMQVKLKTRYGNYLRANGGLPPWRNSITHDVPSRSHTQDWILWEIDVLNVYEETAIADEGEPEPFSSDWIRSSMIKLEVCGLVPSKKMFEVSQLKCFLGLLEWAVESSDSSAPKPVKNEGRVIHYNVVDNDGNIVDQGSEAIEVDFSGNTLLELKQKLEEETGLEDIQLCSRNPLNGKLDALRLALPPNHVKVHVFVVPSSSQAAGELGSPGSPSAA